MKSESDYTDKFVECQGKISSLLKSPPKDIQNWSIQKTVNFKEMAKKCEPLLKLKPASKHADFLKVDTALAQLEVYYK